MHKSQVVAILPKCAEVCGRTEFVIIGSQAIHGTKPDPDIETVIRSDDVDLFPLNGYDERNIIYENLMRELGRESDFHAETATYIEAVPTELARFPQDWKDRTIREVVGQISIDGFSRDILAVFPEIHDLTVSKLAIRRKQDVDFLRGVVALGLVREDILTERFLATLRIESSRRTEGLNDIAAAFGHNLDD